MREMDEEQERSWRQRIEASSDRALLSLIARPADTADLLFGPLQLSHRLGW